MLGRNDPDASEAGDGAAELARLSALSVTDLAVEVMERGFAATLESTWTGQPGVTAVDLLVPALLGGAKLSPSDQAAAQDIVGEGVQRLEHASLVRLTYVNNVGGRLYAVTRLGREAIAQHGTAAHL